MGPTPYLHFRGNCAEALAFYAEVFGSRAEIMRYSDASAGDDMPSSDRVMHGQVAINDGLLMASDFPEGTEGDPQMAVSVMVPVPDPEAGRRLYERLNEGGDPIMAYAPTFWSSGFGMVRDRFGTHWMIAAPEATTA